MTGGLALTAVGIAALAVAGTAAVLAIAAWAIASIGVGFAYPALYRFCTDAPAASAEDLAAAVIVAESFGGLLGRSIGAGIVTVTAVLRMDPVPASRSGCTTTRPTPVSRSRRAGFGRICGDHRPMAFLGSADPAAIGAILGSAIQLAQALTQPLAVRGLRRDGRTLAHLAPQQRAGAAGLQGGGSSPRAGGRAPH